MPKAIFLDRDGVLNKERGEYSFLPEHILVPDDVPRGLRRLKEAGFKLIVITNQGGIAKGQYTREDVLNCHEYIQSKVGGLLDDLFYSPYHEMATLSLGRKPGSLLFERAIALHHIDPQQSWMIGDSKRDMEAAEKVGVEEILISGEAGPSSRVVPDFVSAAEMILK
jgi:D-glycero-D-manno-heptose 1,7-bisphosphate phosphatase